MTHADRMKEIEARMSAYKRTPSRSPLTNALVRDVDFLLARNAALEAALGEAIDKMRPLAHLFEMAKENNESIECTFLERWAYPYDDAEAAFNAIDRLTAIKEGTTDAD